MAVTLAELLKPESVKKAIEKVRAESNTYLSRTIRGIMNKWRGAEDEVRPDVVVEVKEGE